VQNFQHQQEIGMAVQNAFAKLNEAFLDCVFLMSRNLKTDEIAPSLMGMETATVEEYARIERRHLMSAARIGAPLVTARFNDPSTLRQVFSTGFIDERVIAALTKTMPLVPLAKAFECAKK